MVAGASFAAIAAILLPLSAKGHEITDADVAALHALNPREVTVTVTVTLCPATEAPPPVYTTAGLPPAESTTTVPATLTVTSVAGPPGGESGAGSTTLPISSLTPIVPVPVTSSTYSTAESVFPISSTSVTTAMTETGPGTETQTAPGSSTTHRTTPAVTDSTPESTATGGPTSAPHSAGAPTANANLGLAILVAMAAVI